MAGDCRAEAEAAWDAEARLRVWATRSGRALFFGVLVVGGLAVAGVGGRIVTSLDGAASALALSVTVLLLGVVVGLPLSLERRALVRARAAAARARAAPHAARCPRCDAPMLARGPDDAGERGCGRCGASLLEAAGLLVLDVSEAEWRARRWRAAARARLGPPPAALGVSPLLWLGASAVSLLALWATATWLGSGAAPGSLEARFGGSRAGTASAHDEPGAR